MFQITVALVGSFHILDEKFATYPKKKEREPSGFIDNEIHYIRDQTKENRN